MTPARALKAHDDLKAVRGRGTETPGHLATLVLLRKLEDELHRVGTLLAEARKDIEDSRQFRKCQKHMDHAQQRMHKALKRLAK